MRRASSRAWHSRSDLTADMKRKPMSFASAFLQIPPSSPLHLPSDLKGRSPNVLPGGGVAEGGPVGGGGEEAVRGKPEPRQLRLLLGPVAAAREGEAPGEDGEDGAGDEAGVGRALAEDGADGGRRALHYAHHPVRVRPVQPRPRPSYLAKVLKGQNLEVA